MRVLEVGCGQGDTTAVLAEAVGAQGFVRGIDIADAQYGMPITLGQAAEHLKAGPLGAQLAISFETDLLTLPLSEQYDAVVFSHCLWYFDGKKLLQQLLRKASLHAAVVHVAEWDIVQVRPAALAHQMAAYVQAFYATLEKNDSNIRTLFTPQQVKDVLAELFADVEQQTIDASGLQDGQWEIDCARSLHFEAASEDQQHFAASLLQSMESFGNDSVQSLNSFLLTATQRK